MIAVIVRINQPPTHSLKFNFATIHVQITTIEAEVLTETVVTNANANVIMITEGLRTEVETIVAVMEVMVVVVVAMIGEIIEMEDEDMLII